MRFWPHIVSVLTVVIGSGSLRSSLQLVQRAHHLHVYVLIPGIENPLVKRGEEKGKHLRPVEDHDPEDRPCPSFTYTRDTYHH